MKDDFKMNMKDIKILQNSFRGIIKRTNELNKEWIKKMNKEQRIQELSDEIDRLKKKLEQLQKKPYEISYPKHNKIVFYIDDYLGDFKERTFDITDLCDKRLYDMGLYFDTLEEAEQFKREQTLFNKLKRWAKEKQGGWIPDWSGLNEGIYTIDYDAFDDELYTADATVYMRFSKMPFFKTEELAQEFINEFGEEIIDFFKE